MARSLDQFKLNTKVYDRWWPFRHGVVIKLLKTRIHVRWWDGEIWSYDLPHARHFLEKAKRQAVARS